MEFYLHFNLPMDRSPGFGSITYDFYALFRLAFTPASLLTYNLTSPYTITRWTVLQKVRYRALIRFICL